MDDLDNFRQFVLERGPALSRTAYLLTGDHAAAEDLLQETLITAATRWPRVVAAGDPYPWVRRVMLNRLRSWRRPRRLRFVSVETVPEREDRSSSDQWEARLALQQAMRALSPMQRAVLYLRYYEDRTEADTATELGCSLGTVKRHAHDALKRLRTIAPRLLDPPARQVNLHADTESQLPSARGRGGQLRRR